MVETPGQFTTRIFWTIQSKWLAISNFRSMAKLGLPQPKSEATRYFTRMAHDMAFDPSYARFWTDQKAFAASKIAANLPASLVFMHSVLDSSAQDYIKLCAMAAPEDFYVFISAKKVALDDINGRSFDEVCARFIEAHIAALEKESLLKKIETLFQICRPPAHFAPLNDYKYSCDRLGQLDRLRHSIVHSPDEFPQLPMGEADIEYLWKTSSFLFGLVNHRYDVRIEPSYVPTLITELARKKSPTDRR